MSAIYKKALVLGMGESGRSAAKILGSEGVAVTIVDLATTSALEATAQELINNGIEAITECTQLPKSEFDLCVVSPGVDYENSWIKEIESRGIETISELQFGFSRLSCPAIAITGTNGKSTLVKLCSDVLNAAGLNSVKAGNYGVPLSGCSNNSLQPDIAVVEVSSFQMEKTVKFKPNIGVLLNIQPDHLERHGTMQKYSQLKARMFACMDSSDTAVICETVDNGIIEDIAKRTNCVTIGLSGEADYRYVEGSVLDQRANRSYSLSSTWFDNPVLGVTAAAAVAVIEASSITTEGLEEAFSSFEPLNHRMTNLDAPSHVRFIDDSKATNLSAMIAAVNMIDGNIRLIAGGLLKETDLDCAKEYLATAVAKVYLIGDSAEQMRRAWGDVVECSVCGDLEIAVESSLKESESDDTVLLSPGCASFDQFEGYDDRGDQFVKHVRRLLKEND